MAIITYFADSISRRRRTKCARFRYGVLPYAFILVVVAGLVAVEPHLSGAILILGAGAAMMLVGGINWIWVGTAAGRGGWHGVCGCYSSSAITNPASYTGWTPGQDAAGITGYQLSQSLITIGSGGLVGIGPGQEPAEIPVSAGGAQRLHLLHRLRGTGTGRAPGSSCCCSRR